MALGADLSGTTLDLLIGVGGVLLLVLVVLGYRLMRDTPMPRFRRLRFGVFVERDRLAGHEEDVWPDPEQTAEYGTRRDEP